MRGSGGGSESQSVPSFLEAAVMSAPTPLQALKFIYRRNHSGAPEVSQTSMLSPARLSVVIGRKVFPVKKSLAQGAHPAVGSQYMAWNGFAVFRSSRRGRLEQETTVLHPYP